MVEKVHGFGGYVPQNNPQLYPEDIVLQPTLRTIDQFPDRYVIDWRRLSSGLWRMVEGDISAAYSADTFPRVKTFTHGNQMFTNCGCAFSGAIRAVVDAYPLLPKGLAPNASIQPYSYEGRECHFRSQPFQLGPKILFESSDPTVQEWRNLYRVLYADGGYFARHKTYGEFLHDYAKVVGNSGNALLLELEHPLSKLKKEDVLAYLDEKLVQAEALPQMEFKL